MKSFDAVVVGAGVMGAATARWLTRGGYDVGVFERFALGHKRGSSHGGSRIFRLSYDDPAYVAMAQESLGLWRELEAETREDLLVTTGGLDIGKRLDAHAAALASCGARFEEIDRRQLARRWPQLRIGEGEHGLYQPDAGLVKAEPAWRAFVSEAVARGASLHEADPVRAVGLDRHDRRVRIEASSGAYEARVAIVTAGAWARGLLERVGIPLETTPTRETVAYFALDDALRAPSVVDWGAPVVYSLSSPDPLALKVGEHHAGPVADPDEEGAPSAASVARMAEWVARRYPGAGRAPLGAETCLYTNTADESFVLERHGKIVVGSPCSGHGFKFAPLIGRKLASLASEALAE